MLLKDCIELHGLNGELAGIAHSLDYAEDVDLKKVKASIEKISTSIAEIAAKELERLEDVDYRRKMIEPPRKEKTSSGVKVEKKQESKEEIRLDGGPGKGGSE